MLFNLFNLLIGNLTFFTGAYSNNVFPDPLSKEYEEKYKASNYVKQLQWDAAIGLQDVDSLKPSKYLKKLVEENINGEKTN